MTSRDLTENVEQYQVLASLRLVRERIVTTLVQLARGVRYRDTAMGRSWRSCPDDDGGQEVRDCVDELLVAYERVDELIGRYPARGIKGPVGTAQDMLDLLGRVKLARSVRSRTTRVRPRPTSTGQVIAQPRFRHSPLWCRQRRRRTWPPRSG